MLVTKAPSLCNNTATPARPAASSRYCRQTDLPKLIALWPHEVAATAAADQTRLVAKLKRALREERLRGTSGHWSYDLARHSQLLKAYRCEVETLAGHVKGKT